MKYIYIFISALIIFMATSCEKKSEGLTRITYYVDLELVGDDVVTIELGETYVEPGFTAEEAGVDVSSDVAVSDNIDNTSIGSYAVNYSVDNSDGFEKLATRTVVVFDPAAPSVDLSGKHSSITVRTYGDGSSLAPFPIYTTITKLANGVFSVDCMLGNFYSVGYDGNYGYGPAYETAGMINLNADNTFSLIESWNSAWGVELEGFQNATYDPATGDIAWESLLWGSVFGVTFNTESN